MDEAWKLIGWGWEDKELKDSTAEDKDELSNPRRFRFGFQFCDYQPYDLRTTVELVCASVPAPGRDGLLL